MKLEQRRYALAAGIGLIEWTFDPLELKNAFFNIERLGAIVRRYVHNQYGTTTSPLHGGLPTDRLVPEWWIRSRRVESLLGAGSFERPHVEARVSLPNHIGELRSHQPKVARQLQSDLAAQFDTKFRSGMAVIGFERDDRFSTYLLGEWQSP